MISFERGSLKFNFRVVGIALKDNHVLLHKAESDDHWLLPGGRVEFLEPSKGALEREMREEIGVEIDIGRLVWVVENFFDLDNKAFHELALYYLMAFPQECDLYQSEGPFIGDENGLKLIYQWHRLDELYRIVLFPEFLVQGLRRIPANTEHILQRDAKSGYAIQ